MKKLKSMTRSIIVKLLLIFWLILLISSGIVGSFSSILSSQIITDGKAQAHNNIVWQMTENLRYEIEKMISLISGIYLNDDITAMVTQTDLSPREAERLTNIYYQVKNAQPFYNFRSVLIARNGYLAGELNPSMSFSDVLDLYRDKLTPGENRIYFESAVTGICNQKGIPVCRFVIPYYGKRSTVPLAFLIVEQQECYFYKQYAGSADPNGEIYIVNENDQIVSSSIREDVGTDFSHVSWKKEDLVITQDLSYSYVNWTVVDLVRREALERDAHSVKQGIGFITLVSLLVGALISFVTARIFLAPIESIKESMRKLTSGDFSVSMDYHRNDEFKDVASTFNLMVDNLKRYMNDLISQQHQIKKIELAMLQAQISPHFLYNTLNSIIYLSNNHENEKVTALTSDLVVLLKSTIGETHSTVSLQQELDTAQKYINIQNIRYGRQIRTSIYVAPQAQDSLILKMILQPIIENAIVHGIAPMKGEGLIFISVIRMQEQLCIEVTDNGIGMEESQIRNLLNSDTKGHFSSIALPNVEQRIQLLYGSEYGLSITSAPGMGTSVEILLPYLKKEKGQNTDNSTT